MNLIGLPPFPQAYGSDSGGLQRSLYLPVWG